MFLLSSCRDGAQAAFSTTSFGVPPDLAVPSFLTPVPTSESVTFLTFAAPDDWVAVRFLRPVAVYPPVSTAPTATAGLRAANRPPTSTLP